MPTHCGPPTLASLRLSQPMRRVLANLLAGLPAHEGTSGRSMWGGYGQVIVALQKRRLLDEEGNLTEEGMRLARVLDGRRRPDLPGQSKMFKL